MTVVEKTWNVKEILSWISNKFHAAHISSTPLLDAQILLCDVLKFQRIDLYLHSERVLKKTELNQLRDYIKRRLNHEPVAYIIQQKYWYNLDLFIDSNVLIPRPETESLLDFVLEMANHISLEPKIIFDFCTGSGCLGIALAKIFPESVVYAFDISEDALGVAKKNAQRNFVENIQFVKIDLSLEESFEKLSSHFSKADIIVANPPYVKLEEWLTLANEVQKYEPRIALLDDETHSFGQVIFDGIQKNKILREKSIFGMELAHKQPEKILETMPQKKILPVKSQLWEMPLNEWFVLSDLEQKERFLSIIHTPAK